MAEAASITGLGGLLSQGGNYGISKDLSDQAWKRQKTVLKKQIRWRVKDLRAAGLNPILAAGSSLGGGAPSVAPGQTPDLGNVARDAANTYTANRNKSSEKNALDASAANNSAQAGAADAAAGLSREAVSTQLTQQKLNKALTGQASNNARVAGANAALLATELPQKQTIAELYQNKWTRRIMQFKEMISGSPVMNWKPGSTNRIGPQVDVWSDSMVRGRKK